MSTRNNLSIILFSIFITACQVPENKASKTGEGTEYTVNEHDFGDYKKFEQDKSENELKEAKKKKATITKEDSIKTYIKELSHHFHLQEKQMKALEYIYAKYDKKKAQSIQSGDTDQIAKLTAEKEKSIAVVLGEHFYERKGEFDEKYIKEKQKAINKTNKIKYGFFEIPPKGTKPLARSSNRYVEALKKDLNLNQKQTTKLKSMLRQYDHKKDVLDSIQISQLNENKIQMEKEILGLNLYKRKLEFDQDYQ